MISSFKFFWLFVVHTIVSVIHTSHKWKCYLFWDISDFRIKRRWKNKPHKLWHLTKDTQEKNIQQNVCCQIFFCRTAVCLAEITTCWPFFWNDPKHIVFNNLSLIRRASTQFVRPILLTQKFCWVFSFVSYLKNHSLYSFFLLSSFDSKMRNVQALKKKEASHLFFNSVFAVDLCISPFCHQ